MAWREVKFQPQKFIHDDRHSHYRRIVEDCWQRIHLDPETQNLTGTSFWSQKNSGLAVERFYGQLLKRPADFQNKEQTLIRYIFISNQIDSETQIELLKQTVEPCKALELVISMELGIRNQLQLQADNKTLISAIVNAIQYPPSIRRICPSETISTENAIDHHLYPALIVGLHGFLDIAIGALLKVKLVITVAC